MDSYLETFNTWNKIAVAYEEKFMDLNIYNKTFDTFCGALKKTNASVFEIGCGPGNISRYLLSKRPDFNLFGIDIAPKMVELAAANNPTAKFQTIDARNIGELKQNFDGIICGFCLPYLSIKDCETLIANCYHLLNENGIIYLSFVEGNPKHSNYMSGSTGDRVYFYYHSLAEIKRQLQQNNFQTLETFHLNYEKANGETEIHSVLLAQKKKLKA